MPEKNYLQIMEQSLKKKLAILNRIRLKNEEQRVLLLDENLTPDDFDKNVREKGELIEQLELLDQGFEEVYSRLEETFQENKERYREEILALQELIRKITAAGNSIQAEEKRNYDLAQQKFLSVKKQVREIKSSHKAVNEYYRTMTKTSYVGAQFLDNKK